MVSNREKLVSLLAKRIKTAKGIGYGGSSKVMQESFMMLARLIIRGRFTADMLASDTLPACISDEYLRQCDTYGCVLKVPMRKCRE